MDDHTSGLFLSHQTGPARLDALAAHSCPLHYRRRNETGRSTRVLRRNSRRRMAGVSSSEYGKAVNGLRALGHGDQP